MKAQIKALRKKLPKRGYVALVKKQAGRGVSTGQIRNFYNNLEVKYPAQVKIIKASKKAIRVLEKKQNGLKKLAAIK